MLSETTGAPCIMIKVSQILIFHKSRVNLPDVAKETQLRPTRSISQQHKKSQGARSALAKCATSR
jgi:hypothetical protein